MSVIVFFSSCRPVDVCAIDHLPSVLPRESSERFANKMTPYLLRFDEVSNCESFLTTMKKFLLAYQASILSGHRIKGNKKITT